MPTINDNGVLLEDISHKLDAILEDETSLSMQLKNVDERLVRVETDIEFILISLL